MTTPAIDADDRPESEKHSDPTDACSHEPNEESLRAIRETEEMLASGDYTLYDNAASMFAAALESDA